MSLVEGEVIVNIDQVDEGWWYGVSEDGKKQGLFPGKWKTDCSQLWWWYINSAIMQPITYKF